MIKKLFLICFLTNLLFCTNNKDLITTTTQKRSLGYLLYNTTSTTPLAAGQEYNSGSIDIAEYSLISVIITGTPSNASGTLYLEFSPDGTNWDRSIEIPVEKLDKEPPHTALPISVFFRIRYINGPTDQDTMRLQAVFHRNSSKGLTARLEQEINSSTDVENVRAVIVGRNSGGTYQNVRITSENALSVDVKGATSAFGEIGTSEPTAVSQVQFTYGFNPALMTKYENNGAIVEDENSMIKLSTGINQNAQAMALSNLPIRYNTGQGSFCRFSGVFGSPYEGSEQWIGVGDTSNGFFFGYKDTEFGILKRQGGTHETRTLTITNQPKNDQNITITLDGENTIIPVTSASHPTETAHTIAAVSYKNTGSGWSANAVGNTVIFTAWDSAPRNGIYQVTSDESSSNKIEGTFTRTITGRNPQENFIPQSEWNVDPYDGTGITGISINPLKGNVFQIRWQWLGFGAIGFFLENPDTGSIERVHTIQYCNKNTTPSVWDPNLRLHYSVKNTTNTNPLSLYSGSIAGFVDGKDLPFGIRGGVRGDANVRNEEVPIITLRNALIYNGKNNNSRARVNLVLAASNHSQPVEIVFYGNAQLIESSFQPVNPFSFMEYDTSATSFQGGIYLGSMYVQPKGNTAINLTSDPTAGMLAPGSQFTITARSIGSNKSGQVYANFNFLEFK